MEINLLKRGVRIELGETEEKSSQQEAETLNKCPECGGILMEQEGCTKCTCGYSKCSL